MIQTLTIANAGTASSSFRSHGRLGAVYLPTLTGTALTLQANIAAPSEAASWQTLKARADGASITISAAAVGLVDLPDLLGAIDIEMRFVSNDTEAAERTLKVITANYHG
jgi:hypothetical protein